MKSEQQQQKNRHVNAILDYSQAKPYPSREWHYVNHLHAIIISRMETRYKVLLWRMCVYGHIECPKTKKIELRCAVGSKPTKKGTYIIVYIDQRSRSLWFRKYDIRSNNFYFLFWSDAKAEIHRSIQFILVSATNLIFVRWFTQRQGERER